MTGQRRVSILVAGAIALVVAGIVAAVLVIGSPSDHGEASRAGYVSRPITDFVAVSRDGRTLSTFAYSGPCGVPLRNELVAVETAGKVTLTQFVHRPTKAEASQTACALAIFYRQTFPSIRLPTPLGSRMLVQGLTGRPIPTYGGSAIATPTALPTGCHLGKVLPAGDILTAGPPYPKGQHPGITWSCAVAVPFRAELGLGPASLLTFGQWQGRVGGVGIPLQLVTKVHGQLALVKVAAYGSLAVVQERSIEWFEHGQTFVIRSNLQLQPSTAHTKAVLTAAALIRIANGLKL